MYSGTLLGSLLDFAWLIFLLSAFFELLRVARWQKTGNMHQRSLDGSVSVLYMKDKLHFFSKDTWCFHGAGEVLFNILHQELKGCEGHKSTRTPQIAAFIHSASPLLLHKYGDLLRCLWTPWNFLYLCINIVSNIQILTPLTCLNSNNCNSVFGVMSLPQQVGRISAHTSVQNTFHCGMQVSFLTEAFLFD